MKDKVFKALAVFCVLIFYTNNISFAIADINPTCCYPDYATEFCGKDTCERFNRRLFVFNLKLNKYLLRPIDTIWASIMPKYGMDRLRNAYENINFPVRIVSCLLQKDFKASKQEAKRFLINTTLGVGGLYDPAKTKFNLEPRKEDMEQALAHMHVKSGPYLVLPVIRGSVRDVAGKALNCPFNPCSYVLGPFSILANAAFFINNTTYMQPLIKRVDQGYADPYELTKQIDGIQFYIKNNNLDRKEVFEQKDTVQNIIPVGHAEVPNIIKQSPLLREKASVDKKLAADITLENFNSQGCLIDSMRTALFEIHDNNNSVWAETSVWNRCFDKKIKTSNVQVYEKRPAYRFRYILQKNKISPVAIIYPSIGEGINSDHSTTLAKILYNEGFSVIIQGSAFHWEFVKSMPEGYRPGAPANDAQYLKLVTSKIIDKLQSKKRTQFNNKVLIGSSFGAMTSLFVAAQNEAEGDKLGISKIIALNPPVELIYAQKQLDKYAQDWKKNPGDMKLKAAITAQKVINVAQNICDKRCGAKNEKSLECMPFSEDEAKLIMGFVMKQKLADVLFAIEHNTRCKKCALYSKVNKMSFDDYAQEYVFVKQNTSSEEFDYETSLYSIADFLKTSDKYKIFHSLDDYYANQQQLGWLKGISKDKTVLFSNGSHLGFLYRQEFLDEFKKELVAQKTPAKDKV